MARWVVFFDGTVLTLMYENVLSGVRENLGSMNRPVPDEMITSWIVDKGQPTPGDLLVLGSGKVLQFFADNGQIQ